MNDDTSHLRYAIYAILLTVAAANIAARIATVDSPDPRHATPFQSANDRSRWSTVRAIVDEGTFAIDDVIKQRGWDSIDKVWHRGPDGKLHYYSSKPPLLSIAVAGVYWVVKQVTGASFENRDHAYYVGRILLALTQLLPLMIGLVAITALIERYGATDWGRIFTVACVALGSQLVTFGVTFSNHVPAAVAVALAIYFLAAIWIEGETSWWNFVLAGLFTALCFAGELPAAAFAAIIGLAIFWRHPTMTLIGFLPPALLVVFAAQGSNYLVHGTWFPAYSQRGVGSEICRLENPQAAWLTPGPVDAAFRLRLRDAGEIELSPEAKIVPPNLGGSAEIEGIAEPAEVQKAELRDLPNGERYALEFDGEKLVVRTWADWYDYDKSYWRTKGKLQGVDRGEPSMAMYAVHCLVGHHGIFSLSPIWLLTIGGLCLAMFNRDAKLRDLAILTLLVSVICLAFYLSRPQIDRNYGGVSCALRWLLWLHPLWLLGLLPAADKLGTSRWGQILCYVLLAISAFTVFYAGDNPWQHPWPLQFARYMAWVEM